MKWIMEGNRGLTYVRIMRTPSAVLYPNDFCFDFAKSYTLRESAKDRATIVSSGRGVHEALAAARLLEKQNVSVGVIDMPSIDPGKLLELCTSDRLLIVVEQNNGFIRSALGKLLLRNKEARRPRALVAINTLSRDGTPAFIHSATYDQLLDQFGLRPEQIAATILAELHASTVSG
jgi:transketolase C-terminal domain/subunit